MRATFPAICAALLLAAPAAALPIQYDFLHEGFDEGAVVSGSFVGEDLDGNGVLDHFLGGDELTDFSMSFLGNSLTPAFSLGFADLRGFVYLLPGGDLLGDDAGGPGSGTEGIAASDGALAYVLGPGPFALCDGATDCGYAGPADSAPFIGGAEEEEPVLRLAATAAASPSYSTQSAVVSGGAQVPLPGAAALLAPALGALAWVGRRRRGARG